eukprot:CAMPEP_0206229430 /NCGR_PEP_ID=MMETSP0047_2-20121206/9701_1 /ASSEMBLY_ACC=CAM_ASM_000192 /TAXON_ID=195065 /ORGANISM="Chroomonas mesostigmatica_cf, Strain CCMP1168" /LENGTH=234 /DNA_ID=CAMNT_0053652745 /DNA_START=263 /DNA_END=967 /DNA_ORIENTATION=-
MSEQRSGPAPLPKRSAVLAGLILLVCSPVLPAVAQPGYKGSEKYDGYELAPIVKDGKPSPVLLIPVVKAIKTLEGMEAQLKTEDMKAWKEADVVLSQKPFTPAKELKRILNAYSDNIYTSDTSRRNMYLDGSAMLGQGKSTFGFGTLSVGAGGATPLTGETMTYLYRNEALNNVDALQAELKYLIKQREAGKEEGTEDLFKYLSEAQKSLGQYLSGLNQEDVKKAQEYVSNGAK